MRGSRQPSHLGRVVGDDVPAHSVDHPQIVVGRTGKEPPYEETAEAASVSALVRGRRRAVAILARTCICKAYRIDTRESTINVIVEALKRDLERRVQHESDVTAEHAKLLQLGFWWDSTHLACAEHYLNFVFKQRCVRRGTFPEDTLGRQMLDAIKE